jgi:two-component system cell cycle response regulator CtrA
MRILAIDGDSETLRQLEIGLGAERFHVYGTDSGEEGIDLARLYDYDAIVLSETADVRSDSVVRAIRNSKVRTPLLVLSMFGSPGTIAAMLDLGADDYVTKPCHIGELAARLNALVRRSRGHETSVLTAGPLSVNVTTKRAYVHGQPLHLTRKEYEMLELMMLRRGVTITKDMFLTALYSGMDEPELKIIDVFLCKIRRKLKDAGADGMIRTVWGRGYYIANDVEPATGEDMNHAWGGAINRQMHERDSLDAATLVPAMGQR